MAFWKNDDSFAPFNVPQVGPTIPAMPTPDAKDAEIAKLRAANEDQRMELVRAQQRASDWSAACVTQRKRAEDAEAALAAARAALDGYKSPEAAHNLAMRAIEESHRANRAEAALKDCRAALDGERESCDNGVAALTAILDAWDLSWMPNLRAAVRVFVTEQLERRAAEAIAVPPNRTGTPEESQAIADWHHDEIQRRAAEAKASRGGEGGA